MSQASFASYWEIVWIIVTHLQVSLRSGTRVLWALQTREIWKDLVKPAGKRCKSA